MNKKKIELQVLNISNSQAQAGAYALVLGEVGSKRQLPIIIGATEAQAMVIEMKGIVPPRPLTHNLFASVLEVLAFATHFTQNQGIGTRLRLAVGNV